MSRTRREPKKSPSEQLRNVYYNLYLKEKPKATFDEYYEEKMSLLIEHFKKILAKK